MVVLLAALQLLLSTHRATATSEAGRMLVGLVGAVVTVAERFMTPAAPDLVRSLLAGLEALIDPLCEGENPTTPGSPLHEVIVALEGVRETASVYIEAPAGKRLVGEQGPHAHTAGLRLEADTAPSLLHLVADLEALTKRYPDTAEIPGPQHDVLVALEMTELLARQSLEATDGQRLRFKRLSPEAFTLCLETDTAPAPVFPVLTPTHRALIGSTLDAFERLSEAQEHVLHLAFVINALRAGHRDHAGGLLEVDEITGELSGDLWQLSAELRATAAHLTSEDGDGSPASHVRALSELQWSTRPAALAGPGDEFTIARAAASFASDT